MNANWQLDRMGYQANLAAATYYLPQPAGNLTAANRYYWDMQGFSDIGVSFYLVASDANNTLTLTFESSNDATAWVDISMAGYDLNQNAYGTASWVANNSTMSRQVDFDNLLARYFSVKIVVALGGAANNSVSVYSQRTSI